MVRFPPPRGREIRGCRPAPPGLIIARPPARVNNRPPRQPHDQGRPPARARYLFGVADRAGNYNASWALDPASEKRAFERFIDNVMAHWEQHPGFHIYHYGAYETTAVKRLMSRYATREDEVDRLLRGRVFVDLHRVVRQGLRASVESYSIKRLEPFYGFARAVDLTTATRALIQVEVRLESGDAAGVPEPLRTEIEGYNRDDCLSTLRLAAWLEECRRDLQALTGQPVPRPALRDEERDREQEPAVETAALFEALTAGLPVDDAELDDEQRARRLLAHLLEFHRREDKSMWWEFFHRCGFNASQSRRLIGHANGRPRDLPAACRRRTGPELGDGPGQTPRRAGGSPRGRRSGSSSRRGSGLHRARAPPSRLRRQDRRMISVWWTHGLPPVGNGARRVNRSNACTP